MKKFLVAIVLAAGIGAIAYASLSKNSSNKQAIEKRPKNRKRKKNVKRVACSAEVMQRYRSRPVYGETGFFITPDLFV